MCNDEKSNLYLSHLHGGAGKFNMLLPPWQEKYVKVLVIVGRLKKFFTVTLSI